ncbi:MAG: SUMF1/EgtB/PvdO family nonheme iron enzyme [Gallionellaceae bacterium]|nr:SUMF1/EgtB/PvdO family nonheme iron enzyme [Gallionellaceae bacterium]
MILRSILAMLLALCGGAVWSGYSEAAQEVSENSPQLEARFTTLEAAIAEIALLDERIAEIESLYEEKAKRASKLGGADTDFQMLALAEAAPLRARIFALENHVFILGAESLETELADYDKVKKEFPLRFRSTISAVRIAKKASIPLASAEAKVFQQQWAAGHIKPQAKVSLSDDPVLALINHADNTTLTFAAGSFMTAEARKNKLELTFRPAMAAIPVGSFDMGSADYGPVHSVILKRAFEVSITEVTQGHWRAVMGKDPVRLNGCDACPIEKVSWDDVQVYLQKLNAKTGKQYRLPSEAEWEYACRGGVNQKFCGGNEVNAVAWFAGNSGITSHPVASKQANAFGLFDMSGNVWEWVADDYQPSYDKAPVDGNARQGSGATRVVRGGSRSMSELGIGAAVREGFEPTFRFPGIGFRIAHTLP